MSLWFFRYLEQASGCSRKCENLPILYRAWQTPIFGWFFVIFQAWGKLIIFPKMWIFISPWKYRFSEIWQNHIFVKIMKTNPPWNFTIDANYDFSKNVILLNFVKCHFPKKLYYIKVFWSLIISIHTIINEQSAPCG